MDQSEALEPVSASAGRRNAPVLGKRRNFLVSKRYQLRSSLLAGGIVVMLLVFINLMLYQASLRGTAEILADAPQLSQMIRSQDFAQRILIAMASLVFLGGVIVVGIVETHRTAGAAFNIRRQLGEIAKGHIFTRVKLRKGDNLVELEESFNLMAEALSNRVSEDIDSLNRLADDAEQGGDGARIAERLRQMAARNSAMIIPEG